MKLVLVFAFGLLLTGCAKRTGGVLLDSAKLSHQHPAQAAPNLALGPSAEHLRTATELTYRSTWPSVDAGYWVDDVSYLTEVQYDEQVHFDRLGWYYRTAESVHTAVRAR